MKLLHLENGKSLYGGAQQVIYLMQELQHLGVQSELIAPAGSAICEPASQMGIRVYEHSAGGELDWRLRSQVAKVLREGSHDLLHVHSRRGADLWGGLAARSCNVPAVLSRRVDNREPAALARLKYPLYQRVIAISEAIGEVLTGGGLPAAHLRVVRSAVPAEDCQNPVPAQEFLQRFNLTEQNLVVAVVAQLIPRKGHALLLEALPQLVSDFPQLQVLFFGKGAEQQQLEQQIRDLKLQQNVQLVGFHPDITRLMSHFDLLVHPAYAEGLGVSLVQAAAAGCPIVACAAGGIPEIVRDGLNGLLVQPGDCRQLRQAIAGLLGDQQKRQALGLAGKKLATEEFSPAVMARGNYQVYCEVLGHSSAALS